MEAHVRDRLYCVCRIYNRRMRSFICKASMSCDKYLTCEAVRFGITTPPRARTTPLNGCVTDLRQRLCHSAKASIRPLDNGTALELGKDRGALTQHGPDIKY